MANTVFTEITEETVLCARDRVLTDLNAITDGQADKAIKYVGALAEFDSILEKLEAKKATDTQ